MDCMHIFNLRNHKYPNIWWENLRHIEYNMQIENEEVIFVAKYQSVTFLYRKNVEIRKITFFFEITFSW